MLWNYGFFLHRVNGCRNSAAFTQVVNFVEDLKITSCTGSATDTESLTLPIFLAAFLYLLICR